MKRRLDYGRTWKGWRSGTPDGICWSGPGRITCWMPSVCSCGRGGREMSTAGKPLLGANWFRVAAVRPRLRDHVRITRQHFRDERWFVLEDLVESSVHRFLPAAQKAI